MEALGSESGGKLAVYRCLKDFPAAKPYAKDFPAAEPYAKVLKLISL